MLYNCGYVSFSEMGEVLMTPTDRLLNILLERPDDEHYGYDLMRKAKVNSGTLYPILIQLERQGWVESRWEEVEGSSKVNRRRLYTITGLGQQSAFCEWEKIKPTFTLEGVVSHA
jgi:PadR family transcriptional regulator, regulatory protein PadR